MSTQKEMFLTLSENIPTDYGRDAILHFFYESALDCGIKIATELLD